MDRFRSGIEVMLLDIEGTICPIAFVKDTLFPYALEALPAVLEQKWNDPAFEPYRNAFPADTRTSLETFQAHVEDLTRRDVKAAYLKNLQGYLWQSGYESKAYATPLFSDVAPRLKDWFSSSKDIVIYSSGSVFAQKLLFAHVKTDTAIDPDPRAATATEDLTGLVKDWFDTTNAGPKTEPSSYEKIAKKLGRSPNKILFLSDNVKEIQAASDAKMIAVAVHRPGNAALSDQDRRQYHIVKSFDELDC